MKKYAEYARLLAADKDTSDEAIVQYRKVLPHDPNNAEAHKGLAKAYAWNGENDEALSESEKARSLGGGGSELSSLDRDLHKGREPEISGKAVGLDQPSTGYQLYGFALSTAGRFDVSPFVTLRAELGIEDYWNGIPTQSATGAFFSVGPEFRFDEETKIVGALGYHTIAPIDTAATASTNGPGSANLVTELHYQHSTEGFTWAAGFQRDLKTDSFLRSSAPISSAPGSARRARTWPTPTCSGAMTRTLKRPGFGSNPISASSLP